MLKNKPHYDIKLKLPHSSIRHCSHWLLPVIELFFQIQQMQHQLHFIHFHQQFIDLSRPAFSVSHFYYSLLAALSNFCFDNYPSNKSRLIFYFVLFFLKLKRYLPSKYTAGSDNTAAASTTSYLLSTLFWFKMGRDFCRYMLNITCE
jgi:hypothetical protein